MVLRQEMTVFVPLDDPVKVIKLRLRNTTSEQRRLSVTYYAEWVLGVHREGNSSFIVTEWDQRMRCILRHATRIRKISGMRPPFLTVYPQKDERQP